MSAASRQPEAVNIRPVAPADRERWLPLWVGYNRFYEREPAHAVTAITWSRFFDTNEPVHALVAEHDGALVGLVHYLFHRSTSMIGLNCYLQDLFTVAESRGHGVGRALIEGVCERAKEAGAERVYWQTHETNATAMKLYDNVAERSGFIVYRKAL